MFSDSVHSVKASANLYSLVESAKASGLEPYGYLHQVFTALPQAESVEDIEDLLSWSLKKNPRRRDRQLRGSRTAHPAGAYRHRVRRSVSRRTCRTGVPAARATDRGLTVAETRVVCRRVNVGYGRTCPACNRHYPPVWPRQASGAGPGHPDAAGRAERAASAVPSQLPPAVRCPGRARRRSDPPRPLAAGQLGKAHYSKDKGINRSNGCAASRSVQIAVDHKPCAVQNGNNARLAVPSAPVTLEMIVAAQLSPPGPTALVYPR